MRASGWLTAIFTGVLMIFNGLLWYVTKQSTESTLASQRAFLSIAFSPSIEGVLDSRSATNPGKITGYRVHMGWVNNGATPMLTALAEFNVANGADRPARGFDFAQLSQAERQEYVVGPHASWEVLPVPMSFDTLTSTESGRHTFAWGWVVYRDIFKGTPARLSEFCFELTNPKWLGGPDHTNPTNPVSVTTLPCQTHNCYDEQCEDYPKLSELR